MPIAAVVYFVIFLYLDAVLPTEYGVPKPPCFFLDCFFRKKQDDEDEVEQGGENANELVGKEDGDVVALRKSINSGNYDIHKDPLVIKNLRKVYETNGKKT